MTHDPRMAERLIRGIDHVQLTIPRGGEEVARAFYGTILGLDEVLKPAALSGRGGVWFVGPDIDVHVGVADPFEPARKGHVAFLVTDLGAARTTLDAAGVTTRDDDVDIGVRRFYAEDPFGNRLEFVGAADGRFTRRGPPAAADPE